MLAKLNTYAVMFFVSNKMASKLVVLIENYNSIEREAVMPRNRMPTFVERDNQEASMLLIYDVISEEGMLCIGQSNKFTSYFSFLMEWDNGMRC